MPARPTAAPSRRPKRDQPVARLALDQRGVVERRLEEVVEDVRYMRYLQEAADDRQQRERAHCDLHRRLALGDVVVRAGEAHVGVLDLAVGGVRVHLGVVQVALLELARLGHGIAEERAEDHPERVDAGQERADVAGDVEPPVPAAAIADQQQDLVLGEEARERRHAGERQPADHHAAERERHRLPEAAHLVEVLLARHRGDHRAGGHEEQRLEERVRHEVKEAGRVGAGADGHDHVADLRHRRVGDDALEIGHRDRDRAGDEQRQAADHRADVGGASGRARRAGACGR